MLIESRGVKTHIRDSPINQEGVTSYAPKTKRVTPVRPLKVMYVLDIGRAKIVTLIMIKQVAIYKIISQTSIEF